MGAHSLTLKQLIFREYMTDLDWLKAQRTQHKGLPLPQHLAVIMDGNGRWAERWDLSRKSGHHEGAKALRKTVEACYYLEIPYLTLYAFSMENWCRDDSEIADLMELIVMYLRSERDALKEHKYSAAYHWQKKPSARQGSKRNHPYSAASQRCYWHDSHPCFKL